jgi:small GTP-binding protein
MQLAETIERWFGRVEIALAGLDDALRAGEQAIASGDAMKARSFAHAILARVPGSVHGLALLADACELGGLDAELELTLEELARRAASQPEVWLRLGHVRQRTNSPASEVRDAFARALTVASPGSPARKEALLWLADLDLGGGDGARAELWLERLAGDKSAEVGLRRAEARLIAGDPTGALKWLDSYENDPIDGRSALARGKALATKNDPMAITWLVRATLLDVPGASELLSSTLAWVPSDAETREKVRIIVEGRGESKLARFRAAFARAEGRLAEAREALEEAVRAGDRPAARSLLDAALAEGDEKGVQLALGAMDPVDPLAVDAAHLFEGEGASALDALARIRTREMKKVADARRSAVTDVWIPKDGQARWDDVLMRLDRHARTFHDLEQTGRIAALSAERNRPVRVAIVGEFNAGKSTFINALIGEDIAPTGVLPTTATLHHLRYAPDRIARILFRPGADPPERLVPAADLRNVLKSIDVDTVRRVEILVPIASLTRVEILDTPGFNAPDERHAETARSAFEEADAIIWLLDAGQALKQSERLILEEAKAARLPIQILVNKVDRLDKAQIAKVMATVHESLKEIGIRSLAEPLALSARQALAGRLGDAAALESSGWPAVQALLENDIIARSADLKERALRRRAAHVVKSLIEDATKLETEETQKIDDEEKRAKACGLTAARLERDAEETSQKLAGFLQTFVEAWRKDLDVLVTADRNKNSTQDVALARYGVERAVAHLAQPLAQGLANVTTEAKTTAADWQTTTRTAVRAWAGLQTADVVALVRATVSTAIEMLMAKSVPSPVETTSSGIRRELETFEAALER